MTANDRNPRQTALSAFDHGELVADGGVSVLTGGDLAESAPAYEQPYSKGSNAYERLTDGNKYGIMFAGDYEWDSVRCTAEAYGESHEEFARRDTQLTRSLQFHTDWIDAETAKECVREIGRYNGFDGEYVAAAIDEAPDSARFVVGRESSPVLYVWTERADEVLAELDQSNPFASEAPDELAAYPDAQQYPQPQVASTADPGPGRPTLIRAWWD